MVEKFNKYTLTRPRLRKFAGWFLVVVGFIALIAPIIPGAPIMFVGLEILGLRMLFTQKVRGMLKRKIKEVAPVTISALSSKDPS